MWPIATKTMQTPMQTAQQNLNRLAHLSVLLPHLFITKRSTKPIEYAYRTVRLHTYFKLCSKQICMSPHSQSSHSAYCSTVPLQIQPPRPPPHSPPPLRHTQCPSPKLTVREQHIQQHSTMLSCTPLSSSAPLKKKERKIMLVRI